MHAHTNLARIFPAILAATCAFFLQAETRAWLATRIVTAAEDRAPNERAAMLARAIRLDPNSGDALLALGTLEVVAGQPRAALVHLARADALLCDVGARIAMGNAHLALGESRAADDEFRVALHRDRGSLRARTGLAEAQRREGDLDAAKKSIAIAQTLAPYDPHVIDLRDAIDEEQMEPALSDADDDDATL